MSTPEEQKELRKKTLRNRMFYILIGLTILMALYLAFEIIMIVNH